MKKKDVLNAMKARISAAAIGPNTSMPNVELGDRVLPFIEVEFTGGDRTGGTLAGNETVTETGVLAVTINIEKDAEGGEDTGYDMADLVADLFPEGYRLLFTGGLLTFIQPPSIRNGFPDDASYRIPVVIQYRADRD